MSTVDTDLTPVAPHVDPLLGFAVDGASRRLIVSFVTFAFIILGLGALAAFFVVYTRAPSIMLLKPYYYYMALTFHGILMLTMFPHLFEMGLMLFACTALLNMRLYSTKLAWLGFWLCLIGIVTILVVVGSGQASVMYTMYVPLRANAFFYVGHFVYAVGLLLEVIVFALTILAAKGRDPERSLPLITYGSVVMAIVLLIAILSAVVAFVPATLWAFRWLIPWVDPMVFKAAFWGMGHTLQYVNVIGMVIAWYMISAYALHARPVSEKFSRMAFAMYTLTTVPVLAHHLIVDPTFSPAYKYVGATLFGMFLGIPSIMHGLAVPAAVEASVREHRRAAGKPERSWLGFLHDWGWGNPSMILLAFSVLLFGIGGFDGTMATTVPLNMMFHNTLYIVAHFHGTLAGGMAVGFMALSYYFLPALGIEMVRSGWARFQAWCTGIGFTLLVIGMHWAGALGVPRRVQDIHYTAAAQAGAAVPNWFASMNFLPVGGTLAIIGVLTFVIMAVGAVIRSRPSARLEPSVNGIFGEPWVHGYGTPLVASTATAQTVR